MLMVAIPASAGDFFWVGNDPANSGWSQILNWNTQVVPPNTGAHTVIFTTTTGRSDPSLALDWQLLGVRFESTKGHLVQSSGGTLSIGAGGIRNETTGALTNHSLTCPIRLLSAQRWSNLAGTWGSLLSVNGPVDIQANGLTLAASVGRPIAVGGAISGSGRVTIGIFDSTQTAVVMFSGANSYTGGTLVSSGTLATGADDVIPEGTLQVSRDGVLDLTGHHETIGVLTFAGGGLVHSPTHPLVIDPPGGAAALGYSSALPGTLVPAILSGRLAAGTATKRLDLTSSDVPTVETELAISASIEDPAGALAPGPA